MAKLGSGTTLIEVAQTLGYYCNPIKLSELVKHPNLNKWSRCKPIIHVGEGPTTISGLQQMMDAAQWGLEMDYVGSMNTDEEMYGNSIVMARGECWHYSGVTVTRDYPGRLGDFRTYNQEAESPFNPVELYYYVPGLEETKGPVIQLKFDRNTSSNAEINPYDYSLFRNKPIHIVYKKVNESNGYSAVQGTVSQSFTSITSERIQLTSAQTGDYEACAVIYRDNAGEMYPLPNSYIRFNLRNFSKEEYCHLQLANQCKIEMGSTVGQLTVKMQLRNISDDPITATCTCFVYDSRNENLFYNTGTTFIIPARQVLIVYGNENNQLVTTDPGPIRIEDIQAAGTFRPPLYARVTAKNNMMNDCILTKTATILS